MENRKNSRGWIRVVEAFLAILLVTSVIVLVVNQETRSKNNIDSSRVYGYEIYLLRGIELNDTLRTSVLNVNDSIIPVISDNESYFPANVSNFITNAGQVQGALECGAEICFTNSSCGFWKSIGKDLFAQRIFISSNLTVYNPRQLKIFCWLK
jgi:hypothetical protein